MLLALLALAAGLLAGCGGGSEEDARALLKRSFKESIPSANVTIDVAAKVDGVPQLNQPVRFKLGGPYKSNGTGKLPSLNWDVSVSGGGQTFSAGLISTGDRGFVNFQGTNYEADEATMAQLKQAAAQGNRGTGAQSLKQYGVDPLAWTRDAKVEGESDVAGVETKHVTSAIDVKKLFTDLNKIASRAGGQLGQARPQQLTPEVIDQIEKVVKEPKLDVYVGKDDDKIRRFALSLDFQVPEQQQAQARGLKGGNVTVSVEFAGVGDPQTIQAPANAKPLSDLTKQLQGLGGALGATGGIGGDTGSAGGGVGDGGATGSGEELPGGTPGGAPGAEGGGGRTPTSEQFQEYAECLNKTKPSDAAGLEKCSDLLK
jgi:hypothetical protein